MSLTILKTAVSSFQNCVKNYDLPNAVQAVKVGAAAGVAIALGTSILLDINQRYLSNVVYFFPCKNRNHGVSEGFLESAIVAPVLQEVFFRVILQGFYKWIATRKEDEKINLPFGYQIKAAALFSIVSPVLGYSVVHFIKSLNGSSYDYANAGIKGEILHLAGNFSSGMIYGALKEKLGLTASLTANIAYHSLTHLEICRLFWESSIKNQETSIYIISPETLGLIASIIALAIPNDTWKNLAIAALPLEKNPSEEPKIVAAPITTFANMRHVAFRISKFIAIGISTGLIVNVGVNTIWSLGLHFVKPIYYISDFKDLNSPITLCRIVRINYPEGRILVEIFEEILCRGIMQVSIQWGIGKILNQLKLISPKKTKTVARAIAIALSALEFGRWHSRNPTLGKYRAIGATFQGIIYGIVKENFGLRASIATHLASNFLGYCIQYYVLKELQFAYQADVNNNLVTDDTLYRYPQSIYHDVIWQFLPSMFKRFIPELVVDRIQRQDLEKFISEK